MHMPLPPAHINTQDCKWYNVTNCLADLTPQTGRSTVGFALFFLSSLCFNFFQQKQQLPDMEFGRRMATERDLEKTDTLRFSNVGNELVKK